MSKGPVTWRDLRKRSAALRRSLATLSTELGSVSPPDVTDPITAAGVVEGELHEWKGLVTQLAEQLRPLLEQLMQMRERQIGSFAQALSRELRDRGCTVHGEAGLLIVDGIVHLEASPAKGTVKINGSTTDDLDCSSLVVGVAREIERLRGLITPPEEMLRQLLIAYDRETSATGQAAGTQVHTTSMLAQLAFVRQRPAFSQDPKSTNYREYPRDLFRTDLYTLLASGAQAVQGRRFRYASGADPGGAIFVLVPALGRPAHVGRLWFEAQE